MKIVMTWLAVLLALVAAAHAVDWHQCRHETNDGRHLVDSDCPIPPAMCVHFWSILENFAESSCGENQVCIYGPNNPTSFSCGEKLELEDEAPTEDPEEEDTSTDEDLQLILRGDTGNGGNGLKGSTCGKAGWLGGKKMANANSLVQCKNFCAGMGASWVQFNENGYCACRSECNWGRNNVRFRTKTYQFGESVCRCDELRNGLTQDSAPSGMCHKQEGGKRVCYPRNGDNKCPGDMKAC